MHTSSAFQLLVVYHQLQKPNFILASGHFLENGLDFLASVGLAKRIEDSI
jgi:hypothetical protein